MRAGGVAVEPKCIECARSDAGVYWPWFEPFTDWHPTVGYSSPGLGPGRPEPPPAEVYSAPVVSSRDGVPGPEKRAVPALTALAARFGWVAAVTYAKGYVPHATTGQPGAAPRESLAVRLSRGRERAIAVYVDHGAAWSWDTLWLAGERLSRFGQVGAFVNAVFGVMNVIAPLPPLHTTAPWRPPYIYPGGN